MHRTIGLGLALGLTMTAGAAHAVSSSDQRQTLLGWTKGGEPVVFEETAQRGNSVKRLTLQQDLEPTVCDDGNGCSSAAKALRHKKVKALRLKPSGSAPAGYTVSVTRSGHRFHYLLHTPMGRSVLYKTEKYDCQTCTFTWSFDGAAWSPSGQTVAIKVTTDTKWLGYGGEDHASKYRLFQIKTRSRGPQKRPGVTEGFVRWTRGKGLVWVRLRSDSTLHEGDATTYAPLNLWHKKGAWCEGVKGTGRDQKLVITFKPATKITGLVVRPGLQQSASLWRKNGRPTALRILTSNQTELTAKLPDQLTKITVPLPKGPETVSYVVVQLKRIQRGTSRKTTDTCLSLLRPY
ncbi:MAG: hypothetical protein ABI333_14145 [bacterium]